MAGNGRNFTNAARPRSDPLKPTGSREAVWADLNGRLDELLDMLQLGRWEDIPDLEEQLMAALSIARQQTAIQAFEENTVRQLVEKLQLAERECLQRQAQIAPLVETFSKNSLLKRQK